MKLILKFLFFVFSIFSFAQEKVVHYTTFDGLAHDITFGLYQDSIGYLWIGTDDGLVKFDGFKFITYTIEDGLNSNYVIDIKEIGDRKLAIATWRGGLNILDLKTEKITNFINGPSKINNISVWQDTIYSTINNVNYKFWLENNNAVKYHEIGLNNKRNALIDYKLSDLLLLNKSVKIKTNEDEMFYMPISDKANNGFGLIRLKNRFEAEEYSFLKNTKITAVHTIDKQNLIAASKNNLLFCNYSGVIESHKLPIKESEISDIISFNNKEFIIESKNEKGFKYLYSYRQDSDELINLREKYKIKSTISDAIFDRDGNLWISTFGEGIYHIQKQKNTIKTIGLDKNIAEIEFLNDQAYLLSIDKLVTANKDLKVESQISLTRFAKTMKPYKNQVQIGTIPATKHKQDSPLFNEVFAYNMIKTNKNELIVVNDSIRFVKSGKTVAFDKLNYNILDAFVFNDSLFFATNKGVLAYHEEENKVNFSNNFNTLLGKQSVNSVATIKDHIYFGTNSGLFHYSKGSMYHYAEEDGLLSNRINDINIDGYQKVWIGTQKGVSVLNKAGITNFNKECGLVSTYVSDIEFDNFNRVWIAGNKGVSVIDNEEIFQGSNVPFLDIQYNEQQINYSVISFNRKHVTIQYKINKNDWITLHSNQGNVDLSSYKEGNYNVSFRAKKIDSKWNSFGSYKLSIIIPWYKKPRVYVLVLAILSVLSIILILKRLEKSKKKNKMLKLAMSKRDELEKELVTVRNNIAQDFHDDLGNKLARISVFSNLLSEAKHGLEEDDKNLLKQIASDTNYLYNGTKDFIFSLKNESNALEEVVTYLSDFGEDYFRQFNITFTVKKNIPKDLTLPFYWSKQLIFIFKEVMTNVAKHSQSNQVELNFSLDKNMLIVSCLDDGKGFNTNVVKSTNGLKNIKSRAQKINGLLEITSEKGKGTKITFQGKLNESDEA